MQGQVKESDDLLAGFCEEAMDLLQELPEKLSQFAQLPTDTEPMNVVFRSIHTIKGNAGFFGLSEVKVFAHSLEDAFDDIRQGKVELEEELSRCLVEGLDVLGEMIIQIQDGAEVAPEDDRRSTLLGKIESLCAKSHTDTTEDGLLTEILQLADEIAAAKLSQGADWCCRLRALATAETDTDEHQEEPADQEEDQGPSVQSLVGKRFECAGTEITDRVDPLFAMFLAVEKNTYQQDDGEMFLLHMDDLAHWAQKQEQADFASVLQAAREDFATIFNSPLEMDPLLMSVVWERLAPVLDNLRKAEPTDAPPSESKRESSKDSGANKNTAKEGATKSRFLRVREDRVDGFLDDVSRLFITCERLKDLQSRMAGQMQTRELADELRQINSALSVQSTALQRGVVELRKVPVRGLFSKFPRVARSLASKLGKQLDVHLAGEDIEIDKSLVEDLDGPLMHMIRNVCDHGIDTPDEREARGLPPVGNLHLECSLTKSHVLITVEDDGRGIDPERLRAKAVERDLFNAEEAAALSDQEAVELIFHPGFSTAEQVSEVSGRGVGLDVVRTRAREYEGDVKVTSTLGQGTTFQLEIPIRKAVVVIDGLLVCQAGTTFVIPFEHIHEIIRIDRQDLSSVQGRLVASVRGEPHAAIGLDEILGLDASTSSDDAPLEGALIKSKGGTIFLLVESVLGQRKVVVNDLAAMLPDSDKISGVAQLGAGKLALVLNVQELICAVAQTDSA